MVRQNVSNCSGMMITFASYRIRRGSRFDGLSRRAGSANALHDDAHENNSERIGEYFDKMTAYDAVAKWHA